MIVERMIFKKEKKKKKRLRKRKKFIKEIWNWEKKSGNQIINQMKRLGTSVDWNISRFTMDEGLSNAVNEVFYKSFQ